MEEPKRYEDILLAPYVDDVEDQPLRPGHEQYLTYMPKDGELMRGMTGRIREESVKVNTMALVSNKHFAEMIVP